MCRVFLALLCGGLLASCTSVPKTAEQTYRWSRLVRQPSGANLVIGPELPFTLSGNHGVSGFQALVAPGRTEYYQVSSIDGAKASERTFAFTRSELENARHQGLRMALQGTRVQVAFSPAYLDGFLRRVDAVAAAGR